MGWLDLRKLATVLMLLLVVPSIMVSPQSSASFSLDADYEFPSSTVHRNITIDPPSNWTSDTSITFTVRCEGECAQIKGHEQGKGPVIEFKHNASLVAASAENDPVNHRIYVATVQPVEGTTNTNDFVFRNEKVIRSSNLDLRVRVNDLDGTHYTDWTPFGFVNNSHASFPRLPDDLYSPGGKYRGDVFTVAHSTGNQLPKAYRALPDPDGFDTRQAPRQNFTWRLWDNETRHDKFLENPNELDPLVKPILHLSRDTCFPVTVKVDDTAGATDDPDYNLSLSGYTDSVATTLLHELCVLNHVPRLEAHLFPDPVVSTNVTVWLHDLVDPDVDNGYDTVTVTIYDRNIDTGLGLPPDPTSATSLWSQTMNNTSHLQAFHSIAKSKFPFADLSVCVEDHERQALVTPPNNTSYQGPTSDLVVVPGLANLEHPVCHHFVSLTPPAPDIRALKRIHIDYGDAATTQVQQNGTVQDTHVTIDRGEAWNVRLARFEDLLRSTLAGAGTPAQVHQVVIQDPELPFDSEIKRLLYQLGANGTTVLAPTGIVNTTDPFYHPGFDLSPIAAHTNVLTVAPAHQNGTMIRNESARGPHGMYFTKPDMAVATDDTMGAVQAQAAALRAASDLALWYQANGHIDAPTMKKTIQRQLAPVFDTNTNHSAHAGQTGQGVFDPDDYAKPGAAFALDNHSLHPPEAVRNNTTLEVIAPLPILLASGFLDVGVVNYNLTKNGTIHLANINTVLSNLSRGFVVDTQDLLPIEGVGGIQIRSDPYNATRTMKPNVTLNVTYYNVYDMITGNVTDAITSSFIADYLEDVLSYVDRTGQNILGLDGVNLTEILPPPPNDFHRPTAYHFIDEFQVQMPGATGPPIIRCQTPSGAAIAYKVNHIHTYLWHIAATLAFPDDSAVRSKADEAQRESEALLVQLQSTECGKATAIIDHQTEQIIDALEFANELLGDDPFVAATLNGIEGVKDDMLRWIERSAFTIHEPHNATLTKIELATNTTRTRDAPLGPYVGVVRIRTDDRCLIDPIQNETVTCQAVTERGVSMLYITGTTNFHLKDRAGRPMPGRPVYAKYLLPGEGTPCSPSGEGGHAYGLHTSLSSGYRAPAQVFQMTNANGTAIIPHLIPGHFKVHDGFVNFPINITYPNAPGLQESFGFGEKNCHPPIPLFWQGIITSDLTYQPITLDRLACILDFNAFTAPMQDVPHLLRRLIETPALIPECLGLPSVLAEQLTILNETLYFYERFKDYRQILAPYKEEHIPLVFPQVMQGRLNDKVQGGHVEKANVLPVVLLDAWQFDADADHATANGEFVSGNIGRFRYDYNLPVNEEMAVLWSFQVDMVNTEGIAIYTLRDDFDLIDTIVTEAANLGAEEVTNRIQAAVKLLNKIPGYREGGQCGPLAHYRFIPLLLDPIQQDHEFNASGYHVSGTEVPHTWNGTGSAMNNFDNVSRFMRFHTCECEPDDAHVLFYFWEVPDAHLQVDTRFEIIDQRLWTWTGVGEGPLTGRVASGLHAALGRVEPRVDDWSLFIDMMNHTKRIRGYDDGDSIDSQDLQELEIRGLDSGFMWSFLEAPGIMGTISDLMRQTLGGGYLDIGFPTLEALEADAILKEGIRSMPATGYLNGTASENLVLSNIGDTYLEQIPMGDPKYCLLQESRALDRSVVVNPFDVLGRTDVLSRLGADVAAVVIPGDPWFYRLDCPRVDPEPFFHVLRIDQAFAEAHPGFFTIDEQHPYHHDDVIRFAGTYNETTGRFVHPSGRFFENGTSSDEIYFGPRVHGTGDPANAAPRWLHAGVYHEGNDTYEKGGQWFTNGTYWNETYLGRLSMEPGGEAGLYQELHGGTYFPSNGSYLHDGMYWYEGQYSDAFYFGDLDEYDAAWDHGVKPSVDPEYMFTRQPWYRGSNSERYHFGYDAEIDVHKMVQDPARFGLHGHAMIRSGDRVHGYSLGEGHLRVGTSNGPGRLPDPGGPLPVSPPGNIDVSDKVLGIVASPLDPVLETTDQVRSTRDAATASDTWFDVRFEQDAPMNVSISHCDDHRCDVYYQPGWSRALVGEACYLAGNTPCDFLFPPDDRWIVMENRTDAFELLGIRMDVPEKVYVWHPVLSEYIVVETSLLLNGS